MAWSLAVSMGAGGPGEPHPLQGWFLAGFEAPGAAGCVAVLGRKPLGSNGRVLLRLTTSRCGVWLRSLLPVIVPVISRVIFW